MEKRSSIIGLGLILAVAGVCGCAKNGQDAGAGLVRVVVTAKGSDPTRTSYQGDGLNHAIHWCEDDIIGVFAYSAGAHNVRFGDNARFELTERQGAYGHFNGFLDPLHLGSEEPHNIIYHSYFPYSDGNTLTGTLLSAKIPATQYPTAGSYDCGADFLTGNTINTTAKLGYMDADGNAVPLEFYFSRPVAIVKLDFSGIPEEFLGRKITEVTFTVPGREISGDFLIDLDTGELHGGAQTSDMIRLDYSGKDIALGDTGFSAWLTMLPAETRNFEAVIVTDAGTITKTVSADRDIEFRSNSVNRATLMLNDPSTVVITRTAHYKRVESVGGIISGREYLIVAYLSKTHIRSLPAVIPPYESIMNASGTDISTYYDPQKDIFASNAHTDGYAYTITAGSSGYIVRNSVGDCLGHSAAGSAAFVIIENAEWTITSYGSHPAVIFSTKNPDRAVVYYNNYPTGSLDRFGVYPATSYNGTSHYFPQLYIKTG